MDDSWIVIEYLCIYFVDFVILDIELLGIDGFILFKWIKFIQEYIWIFFLLLKLEVFYVGRVIRVGVNGFVSKCKDFNDIYNVVKMILFGYFFFLFEMFNFISNICIFKGGYYDMLLFNCEVIVLCYLVNGMFNKEIVE